MQRTRCRTSSQRAVSIVLLNRTGKLVAIDTCLAGTLKGVGGVYNPA